MNQVSSAPFRNGISDTQVKSDTSARGPFALNRDSLSHLHSEIKRLVAQDIKDCPHSREQVADHLSWLLGRHITVAQIDAITAQTKDNRLPAEWVPAWSVATGSRRILELLCTEAGYWLADETEHELAELGRAQIVRERADAKVEELKRKHWEKFDV